GARFSLLRPTLSAPSHRVRSQCGPRSTSAGKKSIITIKHRPAGPVEYRDDAEARDHADSYEEGDDVDLVDCQRDSQLTTRPRLTREYARLVCHTATKAKPKRGSQQLPILRSIFGLSRGKTRRTSSPESRSPTRRPC